MKLKYPFMSPKLEILPKEHKDDVRNIRNWLCHQPHLPKLTDEHIMLFLHSCYYSGERTKTTIDNYYTVRTQCPELFSEWNWDLIKSAFNIYTMVPLPKTTPEGYHILLYRLKDTDPSNLIFNDALKTFFAFNDVRISEDGLKPGYVVLFDMKGLSMGHLVRVTTYMQSVKKFMVYIQIDGKIFKRDGNLLKSQWLLKDGRLPNLLMKNIALNYMKIILLSGLIRQHCYILQIMNFFLEQDCHPVRLKGVHVINTFSLIDRILSLVKPLMQSDLIQLLHLHSDLSTLNEFVPLELLPADYGGNIKETEELHNEHFKVMETYSTWMEQLGENFKADLKKRVGKPRNQLIGDELEGSFKSLSID